MTVLGLARRACNVVLRKSGLEIGPLDRGHSWDDPRTFLPFHATLKEAADAGLSVSDLVEKKYNVLGATQETIERMVACGVFRGQVDSVCEIGPGSGRYLQRTLDLCGPSRYEIYETASDWADYLVQTYPVTSLPTDGRTLAATNSRSVDLVQAHKVFVATPTLTTCSYLLEMARVVRAGGHVVFDVFTENCLDDPALAAWLDGRVRSHPYPAMMPAQYVTELFARRKLVLVDTFFIPMKPGKTECMVFAMQGS